MALHHAVSGEVVDLSPLGEQLPRFHTAALVKSDTFEAIRLILKEGDTLPSHKVAGKLTLHCLEGKIELEISDRTCVLSANQWIFLDAGVPHALQALEASSLLLTILLPE
jgi:quercetin dioxygenase-like cupin family protein